MTAENRRWLLTGGIGSGKSEVGRLLADAEVTVIDADRVGHKVLEPGGAAFASVAMRWPEVVRDGIIDRRLLAGIVFSDPGELRELEALTHPAIFGSISSDLTGLEGLAVVEVPVLETGLGWPRMVVDCSDEIRFERAVARGMQPEDARRRMEAQPPREQWLAAADLVIPNEGTRDELSAAVGLVLEELTGRRETSHTPWVPS